MRELCEADAVTDAKLGDLLGAWFLALSTASPGSNLSVSIVETEPYFQVDVSKGAGDCKEFYEALKDFLKGLVTAPK